MDHDANLNSMVHVAEAVIEAAVHEAQDAPMTATLGDSLAHVAKFMERANELSNAATLHPAVGATGR